MNNHQFIFKSLRFCYRKIFGVHQSAFFRGITDPQKASDLIYSYLMSEEPCMVARFGSTELMTMVNYLGVYYLENRSIIKYIQGKEPDWWWNDKCLSQMCQWSGFFPPTIEKVEQFCEMMIKDIPHVDILGSWLLDEQYFHKELNKALRVEFELLNPFFAQKPWTMALENKKILVVHPYSQTIESQYNKRDLLFENRHILPDYDLKTIQAVQSLGGHGHGFSDWFEALEYMKAKMDDTDYDICLLGCGAYGFPLAAHAKRKGKKAIHIGGSLQLLFGIKGARWENPAYNAQYNYAALINEHWVRPNENEKSKNASQVENACYW